MVCQNCIRKAEDCEKCLTRAHGNCRDCDITLDDIRVNLERRMDWIIEKEQKKPGIMDRIKRMVRRK